MSSSGKRAAARKYGYVSLGSSRVNYGVCRSGCAGDYAHWLAGERAVGSGIVVVFLVVLSLDRGGTSPGGVHFSAGCGGDGVLRSHYGCVDGQVEVANPGTVPTLIAAGLQLALGMLTAALMWPLMASRVGWLVEHFMQASVWRIVWVVPLAHMLLFIAMMPEDYHTILVNRVQPLGAIILVFLLGLMAFLIELFYRIARSITDSAALREENHFLAAQASQYALLSGYIRETRRLRHDFRQHLRVLSGLAAKGDAAALTAYLKEVGGEEHEEIRFVFANPSLNALAGYYDALARERGVALDWRVSLPEELNIPDAELCVLLGNLVENALDGALTLPEGKRGAKVICRMSGDLLCVIVENGYDGQVRRKKDGFASTKHSGESYGLESARATVARHHGFLTVDAEEDIFRVSLLMNLSANAEGGKRTDFRDLEYIWNKESLGGII